MAYKIFKIWWAKSLGAPTYASAATTHKIRDVATPAKQAIELIYCIPSPFTKRNTDVSNALATETSSPDTGTAGRTVILRFVQKREETLTAPVLKRLITMFHEKSDSEDFEAGRIGLECEDNPELDCIPIQNAGYKLISFKQEPNQNTTAIQIWELTLKFIGDHAALGTRS